MTTLDQTPADLRASGAPARATGERALPAAPAAEGSAAAEGGAARCSIAAAGSDCAPRGGAGAGTSFDGSVPRPRGGESESACSGDGGHVDGGRDGAVTVTGAPVIADVTGFVRLQQPPAAEDRTVPVLRAAQEELRNAVTRRPSPSRRLRRMHPQAPGTGPAKPARTRAGRAPDVAAAPDPDRTGGAPAPQAPAAETPLGILISGTPNLPETAGHPEERLTIRATAELVRLGRGTCLVVLPAWRPAIAVSVPTEQLLTATGLAFDELADAPLSVVINPGALHDRELELRDWRAGTPGRPGRRGGRRQP
ncbi:hypothetical protein [Kitasatospora sp. NBC_00458]|uniref:hypothetical protein n=1 Tax=Kitasatospora sp. NBC_00458 TaxID=2903568 RepID=UPI002E1744ED